MKKKVISLSLIIALLAITVAGTLAYFTDNDKATNVLKSGNVDILLDEAKVEKDGYEYKATDERVQENTYENVYPGQVLPKDPTVHNDGTMDAWVRVKVAFPVISDNAQNDFSNVGLLLSKDADNFVMGNLASYNLPAVFGGLDLDKWTVTQTKYNTPFFGTPDTILELTFTYKAKLEAGQDAVLFTTVNVNPDIETQMSVQMDITAEVVQAAGFDTAEEAFAATFDK